MKPINRTAALVVSKGTHFHPNKKVQTADQKTPIRTRKVPLNIENLTGRRRGRFTVLGLAEGMKGRWVVRCDCGTYSLRRSKAINNPENDQDRCEECRHLAFLKREHNYRTTGRDADIRDY